MRDKPNILIIIFDCLRPDHIGGSGYKGVRTPTFDHLMDEGVVFRNAYCQAPNTWISLACLFTGCNPYRHGVRTPLRKISDNVHTRAALCREGLFYQFRSCGHVIICPGERQIFTKVAKYIREVTF